MTFGILNSDIQEPLSIAAYVHFTHPAIYSYYLIHLRYTAECNRCVLGPNINEVPILPLQL